MGEEKRCREKIREHSFAMRAMLRVFGDDADDVYEYLTDSSRDANYRLPPSKVEE
jgi:hypothetical protein